MPLPGAARARVQAAHPGNRAALTQRPPRTAPHLGWAKPRTVVLSAGNAGVGDPGLGGLCGRRAGGGSGGQGTAEDGTSSPRLALDGTAGLPAAAADPGEGETCAEMIQGPDPSAAEVEEGRIRPFIISSLLLPSPLGGVRGGNNRHQVLDSLFFAYLLKY